MAKTQEQVQRARARLHDERMHALDCFMSSIDTFVQAYDDGKIDDAFLASESHYLALTMRDRINRAQRVYDAMVHGVR